MSIVISIVQRNSITNFHTISYTHYFDVYGWGSIQWQVAWAKLIEDTRLILEAADVPVCGPGSEDDNLTSPLVDVTKGIWINGVADDSHEPFVLGAEHDGFCKTLMKPYDVIVASILLRTYMLCPNNVEVG